MNLSDGVKTNDGAVRYSPCGTYLAVGYKNILRVFDFKSSDIIAEFTAAAGIKAVDWAFDSVHVLCVLDRSCRVQAFSLIDPEWICTIEPGETGLNSAVWSPASYHILILAEFNARISVWSLTGRSVAFIDNPIIKNTSDLCFSKDGNYFAVITGPLDKYKISIFSTSSWILKQEIYCSHRVSIPNPPLWSPINLHLAIWDTTDLTTSLLEVYSLEKSLLVGTFERSKQYRLCGISVVSWVRTGQFLLVGCHDESIYVLNYITWSVLSILKHCQVITESSCRVYEESEERGLTEIRQRVVTLSRLKTKEAGAGLPGVAAIASDSRGNYVATRCKSMPAVVWLWEVGSFALKSIVVSMNPVSNFAWNPRHSHLLISSRSNAIVLWRPQNPAQLRLFDEDDYEACIRSCEWNPGRRNSSSFCAFTPRAVHVVYDHDK